ncbi:MAG: cytochrome c oxidase subunit II [Phycisphaerae bacterium]|nr:cytochrome c oxidase subunit II [Phycisphaerae bacterium]
MTATLAAASDLARQVDRSFWLIGAVALALLLLITTLMVVFAIRYRRSRSPVASQTHGHTPLEVAWIIVPTLIVCWMFVVGIKPFVKERKVPQNAYVIQVTGRQWAWSFTYPDTGVSSGELVVPANVPIKLELASNDVIHGFYVPDLRLKEDVVPGYANYVWFKADKVGAYVIFCSQFCGKDHSQMHTLLRVLPPHDYDAWVRDQIDKRYRPLTFAAVASSNDPSFAEVGLDAAGRTALFNNFCASCHGPNGDGSGLPGLARNFTSPANWKNGPKASAIFRTLNEGFPATQMRPFPNLSPYEKLALAHYVRHFLAEQQPPKDTRADYDALVKQYELDKIARPPTPLPI